MSELQAEVKEGVEARARLEEEYGYALQEAGQREDALREELAASQVCLLLAHSKLWFIAGASLLTPAIL